MTSMEDRCAPYRSKLNPAPFASIVPGRSPEVKYHAGLGRAKSAVAYTVGIRNEVTCRYEQVVRGGEIYKRAADGWELLYRVEQGTPTSELPWKESP